MKEIWLTQGYVAIVDDEDYRTLLQWTWRALPSGKNKQRVYAVRSERNRKSEKARSYRTIFMHREVYCIANQTPIKQGMVIDHLNRNGLDNRRQNLRIATKAENNTNKAYPSGKTSAFRGVHFVPSTCKWGVRITSNKKSIYCGRYKTEVEAAIAYNKAATIYHGEFAILNIIPSE